MSSRFEAFRGPEEEPPRRPARGRARVPWRRPEPPPRRKPPVDEDPAKADPLGLIPGPDETTLLPRVPSRHAPPPDMSGVPEARRKRGIRRHRDGSAGPARRTVRVAGELILTFGVVVLMFVGYELWGTSAAINDAQAEKSEEWEDAISGGKDPTLDPVPGNAVARLYMPQIRAEPWVIVEGTDLSDIETAPGRYTDGAMPGEKGNFAMAGHNVPAIFRHIDSLKEGDEIVVETKSKFFIYEITGNDIVKPSNWDVVAPVPNEPEAEPGDDDHWLTMTTCHPWWDNYERFVVWAQLSDAQDRGSDLPPEAKG